MNQQAIAIVIAGALIASAIALTNHWALYTLGDSLAPVLRLNRWTGNIVACGGMLQPGWELHCPIILPPKAP